MAVILSRKSGGGGGSGAPSGPAGGSLAGTYPDPTIAAGAVDTAEIAGGAVGRSELASGIGVFDRIADSTLGVAGSFDFTAISSAYNHLRILFQVRGDTAATNVTVLMRFNNDSGNNYYLQTLAASAGGSTSFETLATSSIRIGSAAAASAGGGVTTGVGTVDIPNYANTTFHKSCSALGGRTISTGSGDNQTEQNVGRWANTAAISRIQIIGSAGAFDVGSRVTVYGLG